MDFGGHLRQNPCSVGLFILAPRVTFVTQTSCPEQNPVGQERLDLLLSPAPTPALTACLLLSLENSASNADAPSNKFVFGQNMSERVLVSGPHGPGSGAGKGFGAPAPLPGPREWCGCHTVSYKIRMLSVASKRKTQLGPA